MKIGLFPFDYLILINELSICLIYTRKQTQSYFRTSPTTSHAPSILIFQPSSTLSELVNLNVSIRIHECVCVCVQKPRNQDVRNMHSSYTTYKYIGRDDEQDRADKFRVEIANFRTDDVTACGIHHRKTINETTIYKSGYLTDLWYCVWKMGSAIIFLFFISVYILSPPPHVYDTLPNLISELKFFFKLIFFLQKQHRIETKAALQLSWSPHCWQPPSQHNRWYLG